MTDRFVVVPASYVFLLRPGATGDEVLLQLRQNTGYMDDHWAAAAAGHVERGETAYDAAHREALEELDVTGIDLTFVTAMHRTAHADPIDERIDFSSRPARGRERPGLWNHRSAPACSGFPWMRCRTQSFPMSCRC